MRESWWCQCRQIAMIYMTASKLNFGLPT